MADVRRVSVPIRRELVDSIAAPFVFMREWVCACGARLKIRARLDRGDGPSNFLPYPPGHKRAGHSKLPSSDLTWNGLAAERGWKVDPEVQCPACQLGVSVADYKAQRRAG